MKKPLDFKATADIMEANQVENKWYSQDEFNKILKKRKLELHQVIDGDCATQREVYTNKTFAIIVVHDLYTKEFKIL